MINCAPYAIHVVTGAPYDLALDAAIRHGWRDGVGMDSIAEWNALKEFHPDLSRKPKPTGSRRCSAGSACLAWTLTW
ncbi:hypothetical protein LMG29542_02257 [Paraburkholderia humisilvae]|uniref:Uncharacterized protein n=1 Tax=Paraburkholderia humisilvae TaxID=627669 RepID=A0A6J5DL12_9BURK|nr:hypothetical protein LMG29542_02257 [Paraburkholderia humisilvae]